MLNSAALLLSLTLPVQDDAVTLVWNPEPGPAHHEWVTAHHLFVDSIVRQVDDQVIPMPTRFSVQSERKLVADDELELRDEERPLVLRREYKSAEMVARMQPLGGDDPNAGVINLKLTSPVEGTSVVWTWVPQEGEYGRYYDALEGSESALALLRLDLDLRALLPERPVKVGSSWDIAPLALRDVLEPGGRLSLSSERGNELFKRNLGAGIGGGLYQLFTGKATGSVRATLQRVEGERAFVRVRLDGLRYLASLDEYIKEHALGREKGAGLDLRGGRLIIGFDGDGTLVWNLAQGRPESFDLSTDETVEVRFDSVHPSGKPLEERLKMVGGFLAKYSATPGALELDSPKAGTEEVPASDSSGADAEGGKGKR